MNYFSLHLLYYSVAFVGLWLGSGWVISSVVSLSKMWRLPLFTISFFLLGILTSLPELSIGISAVADNDPAIFVGNLLGGVIVLFLCLIPLLGIFNDGIKMPKVLSRQQIMLTLLVVLAPSLLTADRIITFWEGILLILMYLLLFIFLQQKVSVFEKIFHIFTHKESLKVPLVKIALGVFVLYISSTKIVKSTLFFADYYSISAFFVSLIVVALGTNLPEFSIIIRSLFDKQKDLALADYFGSASANTLLMGILVVVYRQPIFIPNYFLHRFIILVVGLVLFFIFSRSKNMLSRAESAVLFLAYLSFIMYEVYILAQ